VALWQQWCAGAYTTRSPVIDSEACLNLFPETIDAAENPKRVALYGTPGLKTLLTASITSCRGTYTINGRTFAVIGTTFGEVNLTLNTFTSLGSVASDNAPVSMVGGQLNSVGAGSGTAQQLLVVSGGNVYVLTLATNAFSAAIALPLTNAPVQCDFLDNFFLLTEKNTIRVWFTTDASVWNALNFFARSDVNDNVVAIKVTTNRIYVFGSKSTETFYDAGGLTQFLPYPGTAMLAGLVSPWAVVIANDQPVWLVADDLGQGRVLVGANQTNLATHAVRFAWSKYPTLSDAEAFVYDTEGHVFVGWTFPSGDATWVLDLTEGVWHQRDTIDTVTNTSHRWRARGISAAGRTIIAGDATNGNLYQVDMETFTDAGGVLRRLRRAPYVSAENQWLFIDQIELGLQAGVGLQTGQGSAPTLQARVSRDGGHTWGLSQTGMPSSGAQGVYGARALWRRLGRVRADRFVFEVTQTDAVRTVWGPGLYLRTTPGSGQL
jgi:hypothetical protein